MACGRTPCEDELGLPCGSASLEVCPFAATGGAPEAEPKSSPATDCESGLCRERVCFWGSGRCGDAHQRHLAPSSRAPARPTRAPPLAPPPQPAGLARLDRT